MGFDGSQCCLTHVEIQTLDTIATYGLVSVEIFADKSALKSLENKGFIEKIHQDAANIDRYRLTIEGRIKNRQLNSGRF